MHKTIILPCYDPECHFQHLYVVHPIVRAKADQLSGHSMNLYQMERFLMNEKTA
jgi:hypothetical protein